MSNLGSNVRFMRKQLGMTLAQLSTKSGLDISNLSKLERGLGGFSREGIDKLCAALGVSESTLFSDDTAQSVIDMQARRIPILSPIQAAEWVRASAAHLPREGQPYTTTDLRAGRNSFAMLIFDEAMGPLFAVGDMIVADPDIAPLPGDFVVASPRKQPALFRQYRVKEISASGHAVIELVPLNPLHPIIKSESHPIRVVGTMMEHRRFRKDRR
jgi:transcriptional regulator with XRE-family HTH domain